MAIGAVWMVFRPLVVAGLHSRDIELPFLDNLLRT